MTEQVECYSGSAYGERPRAFTWQGQRLEIIRLVDRWRQPGERGFRVSTPGGQEFMLVYDEQNAAWSIREIG